MNPKVSIIIPIYNAEPYIDQCVQSILSQSFHDWEMILINDGSRDHSLKICEQLAEKDDRIHVLSQSNMGVSSARNTGLMNAVGEYVTFIDVDDYVGNDFFAPMAGDTDEDVIFVQYNCFDEQGTISDGENIPAVPSLKDEKEIKAYLSQWLHQNIMRTPWGKFIRRDVIGDERFPLNQTIGEDSVFMFSVLQRVKSIRTVETAYYMWRTHADFFLQKYQLPVDVAISYLINIYNAYRKIGASSPHLEATLYFTFFCLSEKSIGMFRWRWFARPVIIRLWSSVDFDYMNIHKQKFKKYKWVEYLYRYLDKGKFIIN